MNDTLKYKALNAMTALSAATNSAIDARSYALSCFHEPHQYWADHVVKLIAETREHLNRADAILTAIEKAPANV